LEVKYNGNISDYTDDSQCRGILFGIFVTPWRSNIVCRDELLREERMIAGKHEHWSSSIALDKNSKVFYNGGAGVE
jgi:hypothetical protein